MKKKWNAKQNTMLQKFFMIMQKQGIIHNIYSF